MATSIFAGGGTTAATYTATTSVIAPLFTDGANYSILWDAGNGVLRASNAADSTRVKLWASTFITLGGNTTLANDSLQFVSTEAAFGNPTGLSQTAASVALPSGRQIVWSSTTGFTGTADLGLARNAANVLEVNTGTIGTLAGINAALYKAGGTSGVTAGPFTVIASIQVKGGLVIGLSGS